MRIIRCLMIVSNQLLGIILGFKTWGGIIAGSEAREGDDEVIIGVFGTGFAKTEISYLGI